jgi:hypothetical protein
MSADSAHQLAILRAKVMLALLNNSKISGLNDYYVSEKDLKSGEVISSVYREYSKIASTLTFNNTDFTVEEEVLTNSGEAIILASLTTSNRLTVDTTTINCLAEVSGSHLLRNEKHTTTSRFELTGGWNKPAPGIYFNYIVKKNNRQIKILSDFSGAGLRENNATLSYKSSNDSSINPGDPTQLSCTMQHGLWYAYAHLTLQKIVLDFNESNVVQSSLNDQHTRVNQNINRVLIQKNLSFKLETLEINNNKLYLNLNQLTHN